MKITNFIPFIIFIFLFHFQSNAQVVFDAAATSPFTMSQPVSIWNHTCSGTNRLLVVSVSIYDSADSVSTITYNGDPLTKKKSVKSTFNRAEIWYLVNPDAGTFAVSVTGTSAFNYSACTSTSYTGVNQTSPTGNSISGGGNSTAPAVTLNSATNNMIVDALSAYRQITGVVGAEQTQRGLYSTGGVLNHGASTAPGAASVTMDWTLGLAGYWAIAAMEINASGGGTNMTYTSSTATQNTNPVNPGSLNQQIIGMQIVTTGTLNPLSVSEFRLRTDGTTNYATDITNMRVYYTGTNSTFSATGQFGTAQTPLAPGNNVTFTGTQTLASGTNYFWVTYDITAGATVGNVVDAQFQQVNVGGNLQSPSTSAPTGNRPIQAGGTNMTHTSSTATQNNTNPVTQGTTNQEIIGMQVVTTGTLNPISVSEFRLRTDGTTNYATDITNMRVYYTGTNSTFSATGQFGTAQTPLAPGNDVTFTGTQTLASGTNYFWLTYDITGGATVGNVVDAIFQRVNVGGTLYTPSTTNPSGNRPIQGSGTNMTYSSSTVTQASTADVYTGSVNQQIIRVQVVTSGTANPLNATSFRLRTNGSTSPVNDINNAKIYYTGSSATFATTTLFGTNANPPAINTDYTISGTQQLVQGNNYFWVTYDIEATATANNDVDALCNQITVGGANYTPSATDPAGSRNIVTYSTNDCDNAIPLSVGTVCYYTTQTTTGATASNIPNGACGNDNVEDVWFKTVVPSSGSLVVKTAIQSVQMDGVMAIYYGPCNKLTEITCLDDVSGTPVDPMPTIYRTDLEPGAILYIRFWEKNGLDANFRLCLYDPSVGQGIDADQTQNNPQYLVDSVLISGCLEALNIDHTGAANSISYFNKGQIIGFNDGIILASGSTTIAEGANNSAGAGNDAGTAGDADLTSLSGQTTNDASILEFDFIPSSDTVSFRYVFGSEEYPEYVCSQYNDVFGFFLSGPGITGPYTGNSKNIALVPNDVSGTINPPESYFTDPVAINSINIGASGSNGIESNCTSKYPNWKKYVHYFVKNGDGATPIDNKYTQYDGYTVPLVARAVVQACKTYHIKLAVADASDGILDSGVFLEANSLKSPDPPILSFTTATASLSDVFEGCTTSVTFTRYNTQDVFKPDIVYLDLTGSTATSGTDYPALPNPVIIPPGDSAITINITPYIDAVNPEGNETIVFNYYEGCPCNSTLIQKVITIRNYVGLQATITNGDTHFCEGVPINLTTNVVGQGVYTYMWNTGATTANISINPTSTTTYHITATDKCGNSDRDTVTITFVSMPTTTFTNTSIPCSYSNNVTFSYTGNAGSGSQFFWSFPGGTPNSSANQSPTILFPPGNSYTVRLDSVKTQQGCKSTSGTSKVITIPSAVTGTYTKADVKCFGNTTGSIDLFPSGGTPNYTYLWTPGNFTTQDITNLTAGTYSVQISDLNSCVGNVSVNITQPAAALSANAPTKTTPLCFGNLNGSIEANPTGGTSPYTYQWNLAAGNQTTKTATNLGAGTYSVVITDINSCTFTDTYTLTQPNEMKITANITDAKCNQNNGSASINVSQGTSPYFYLWSTGATGPGISGVYAGSYGVTITDNNGCIKDTTIDINDEGAPVADIDTVIHVSCFGFSNGEISITSTGGSSPYTYIWAHGPTGSSVNNLTADYYFVTVTDQLGCKDPLTIQVKQPTAITSSVKGTNVLCFGQGDGAADLSVIGGTVTSGYTYLWNTPDGSGLVPAAQDQTGLSTGSYYVTITDNNGCVKTDSVKISVPNPIVSGILSDSVLCFGQKNGSADLTVSGGTVPYGFKWSNGQTNEDISNQASGKYYVTITDKNTCTRLDSIMIYEPAKLIGILAPSNLLCNKDGTGAINLTITGGTKPYHILWSNGAITEDISNLPSNTYSVAITDTNECVSYPTPVFINEPQKLNSDIDPTDALCNGQNNGSATLDISGGTTPYTYSWSDGQTTQDLSNVSAGKYYITLTDAHNCTLIDSVTIKEPTAVITTLKSKTDAKCFYSCDGIAEISASGGTSPYTILWADNNTDFKRTDLCAGSYSPTVTDDNGCPVVTSPIVITKPDTIVISIDKVVEAYCGKNDGMIIASAKGGVTPYTFFWSPSNQVNDTAMNLYGNTDYTLLLTDKNNCYVIMDSIYVGNFLAGNAFISDTTDASCYGYTDGAATVGMIGGTPPFTYSWSNFSTSATVSNLVAGPYSVTVTDVNSCSDVANVIITQPSALTASIPPENIIPVDCYGSSSGSAKVNVSGSVKPYTYLWPNNDTDSLLNNVLAGPYTVTITDAHLCKSTASVVITQPDSALTIQILNADSVCYDKSDGNLKIKAQGGTFGGGYTYKWSVNGNTDMLSDLPSGDYFVTVTDAKACTATKTVTIKQIPLITYTSVVDSTLCLESEDGKIKVVATSNNGPYEYLWDIGLQQTSEISDLAPGTYTVTITDNSSCTASTSVEVKSGTKPCLEIPTVITPNGDEKNDTWKISRIDLYESIEIKIFNRWGELVFEFEGNGTEYADKEKQWDGTNSSNGKELPMGSYIYIVKINNADPLQGIVTILRKEKN